MPKTTLEISNLSIPVEDEDQANEVITDLLRFLDTLSPDDEVNFDFDILEDGDEE